MHCFAARTIVCVRESASEAQSDDDVHCAHVVRVLILLEMRTRSNRQKPTRIVAHGEANPRESIRQAAAHAGQVRAGIHGEIPPSSSCDYYDIFCIFPRCSSRLGVSVRATTPTSEPCTVAGLLDSNNVL
jgi:hypothetical protein